jgi:hypothetical protein
MKWPDPLRSIIEITLNGCRKGSWHPAVDGELSPKAPSAAPLFQQESPHELRELGEVLSVLSEEFLHVLGTSAFWAGQCSVFHSVIPVTQTSSA